ncbi:MAG: InlB B-repeat-containing protein [Tissierellia bacterium]|nr:InlB B-repeat-containing protein [Tissierellia bacterium]
MKKVKAKRLIALIIAFMMTVAILPQTMSKVSAGGKTIITEVVAKSNIKSIFKRGNDIVSPVTFEITSGKPATFSSYGWQKKIADKWENVYVGKFSTGTWRYSTSVRLDGDAYKTHGFSEDLKLKVDGVDWTLDGIHSMKDYAWANFDSMEFELKEEGLELVFYDDDSFDIEKNNVNKAIYNYSVAGYVDGGKEPYKFSKTSGPDWIEVSPDGEVSGTPKAIGKNSDLVIRVTDDENAYKEITVKVGETFANPDDDERIIISEIVANSNIADIVGYGRDIKSPTFEVLSGKPAYFLNAFWEKKSGSKWIPFYKGKFGPGIWRLSVQVRIDENDAKTHKLDKSLKVKVDGVDWKIEGNVYVGNEYSSAWPYSQLYALDGPNIPTEYDVNVVNGKAFEGGVPIKASMKGATIVIEADDPPEGQEFDGWEVLYGGIVLEDETKPKTKFKMPEEDVGVKAKFKEKEKIYTIKFDLNGGTLKGNTGVLTMTATEGDSVAMPEAPKREGYNFTYWKGSKYNPGDIYIVKGDHTFVAQWEKIEEDDGGDDDIPQDIPNDTPTDGKTPNTGDRSEILTWLALMIASMILLVRWIITDLKKKTIKR